MAFLAVAALVPWAAPLLSAGETVAPLHAICGAYPPEMTALHKEFGVSVERGWMRTSIHGVEFWRGTCRGKDLLVFRTGMSLVNAAYQLQVALDNFPITDVLFAGVAGGIDPDLHVGDVVIPERWAYHSEAAYLNEDGKGGYILPTYLKPKYENFGMIFPDEVEIRREGDVKFHDIAAFPVDEHLLAIARQVVPTLPPMRKAGRDVSVLVGGTSRTLSSSG